MNVKEFRISHQLTQSKLAEICGVTLRTVQNWETRKNAPKNVEILLTALERRGLGKAPELDVPQIGSATDNQTAASCVSFSHGVPYYDEDFVLGFTALSEPGKENPQFLVDIPKYNSATLWCNATGHSMEPEINSGDVVALKLIDDPSFLLMGDVYAIVTTNGLRTIKRVKKGSTPDSYLLVPSNPAYESQEIPKDKIMRVFRVLGNIHGF